MAPAGLPPRANSNVSASSTIPTRRPQPQVRPQRSATTTTTTTTTTSSSTQDVSDESFDEVNLVRYNSVGTTSSQLTIESLGDERIAGTGIGTTSNMVDTAMVRPVAFTEARDVSASSRDSLRRQVFRRRMSLTVHEQSFLDDLVVNGNEIEVQLAFERLQDDELFFDYQTPKDAKFPYNKFHQNHHNNAAADCETEQKGDDLRQAPSRSSSSIQSDGRPTLQRSNSQLGSQRRLAILEQRKSSGQLAQLWKAHKTGLAITNTGSKLSLVRRSSSIGSLSTVGSILRAPSDIFRPVISKNNQKTSPFPRAGLTKPPTGAFRRSRSLVLSPGIPPPRSFSRRLSSSSRKSVTFHEKTDGTPKPRRKTLKTVRRTVSDSFPTLVDDPSSKTSKLLGDRPPPLAEREESSSSIPSLHPAYPVRSESISSIPSLHHGTPLRSNSISSIPSLHHGMPIRSDSISSIPSIHHASALRSESMSSIPSLHQATPVRRDSMSSIPSLRPGMPLRSDSVNSFASLLLGQPLSINTINIHEWLNSSDATIQDAKAVLLQQYAASDDIAAAWLKQQSDQSNSIPPAPLTEIPRTPPEARPKPVLLRMASANIDNGEGIEVSEWDGQPTANYSFSGGEAAYLPSLISLDNSIRTSNSFDTMQSYRHPEIFRGITRSLSDDDMGDIFLGQKTNQLLRDVSGVTTGKVVATEDVIDDETSWDMSSVAEGERFDSWNVLKDEYVNGYGGGGTLDFSILGTDGDDESAQPHVLSPPLMESLQSFLPYSVSGQNFYLKYSMVRDGASFHSFLKRARGVQYSILALETVDGEVFGAFTAQAWRKNWNYFGTGESFLWRMRRSRYEKTHDILEQAQLESEIDVYPYTGENQLIQLCTHDRIALGGGTPSEKKTDDGQDYDGIQPQDWGFGLAISNDFLTGTSSPCVTFGSASLSQLAPNGNIFEIVNMELWALTPCGSVEEAEKLELGKLFLQRN